MDKPKIQYISVYKCRLCKKTIPGPAVDDPIIYMDGLIYLEEAEHQKHSRHICENGNIGLADLQGLQKMEIHMP